MKNGPEQVLPYNNEEEKGEQGKRMFESIKDNKDYSQYTSQFGIAKNGARNGNPL